MEFDSILQRLHTPLRVSALLFLGCAAPFFSGCAGTVPPLSSSQIALSVSPATINVGGSISMSAKVTGDGTAPIGTVTFYDASTNLQTSKINSQTATATATGFAPGAHNITAVYGGDPLHNTATSSAASVSVYSPTSTTLSSSSALAGEGDAVTLIAKVTAGSYIPTGNVTFSSGGVTLGTAALSGDSATLVTTALPLGTDSVVATFPAQGYYLSSASTPISVVIHPPLLSTVTSISSSATGTVSPGTTVTLNAVLTPASGNSTAPTGSVTFYENGVSLGSAALASNSATLATKQFVTGANSLTAVYSGDAIYASSTSTALSLTLSAYTGATYTNPLSMTDATTGAVYNCPDPAIIKSQAGSTDSWYAYCTGSAFNSADTVTGGALKAHLISIFQSSDLVHWNYVRDAFSALPSWVATGNDLETPAIKYFNGLYHLYYEAPAVKASPNGSAIGVGTASTPAGPFTDSGSAVVAQQLACGNTCNRTVFAPEVIDDGTGQLWIAYGGVYAGLSVRKLNTAGTISDASSEVNIAVDNYYTNPYLLYRNGYFYEFATPQGACCSGAYSTYSVRVGRSTSITGPYLDAEGNDMNAYAVAITQGAPGGDTVLVNTGNDIVGGGSNVLFTDESGQDYLLYSGVSKKQPYLPNQSSITARQLMMDAVDWVNGWPVVRNGAGASDYTTPQPVPAAQPGASNGYVPPAVIADAPGTLITASSDEFNATTLSSQWSFLHATPSYTLNGSSYAVPSNGSESVFATDMANLPILSETEPSGNYLLEVKVASNVPSSGCCQYNYAQAGLFIYSSDNVYLRLDEFANYDTRQIEFVNQIANGSYWFAPVGTPYYQQWTYLRVVKRVGSNGNPDTYTSYSSIDGVHYLRGPAWTTSYPSGTKIGLFAGNLAGYIASFDYVRVYTLTP